MKYAIGMPTTEPKLDRQFVFTFLAMDKPDYTLMLPSFPSMNISALRNDLVKQAIVDECDYLIMLDTDQIYPVDTITKLLSHKKEIVGARVHRRYPPFEALMYEGELTKYRHVPDEKCYSGKLVEVDATGSGCLCIDMRVFEKLNEPWFLETRGPDGKTIGEDIFFCHNAKQQGISIYVDTSIDVGHLSTMVVNRATYEVYKKIKGYEWNTKEGEMESIENGSIT
jgi:hypothetical protein